MTEATSDNVFDVGSNEEVHLYSLSNSFNVSIASIIDENIQKILTSRSFKDVGVEFNKDVRDNDAEKLISGPELHSNPSEDAIYS